MRKESYRETVDLLLEILPYALEDKRMALKGGTAINLFHRDYPRMSVDIDLCYLPLEDRDKTFKNIHRILLELKNNLENKLKLKVSSSNPLDGRKEVKLVARNERVEVKIEPNFILRSCLFEPEEITLAPQAIEEYTKSVKVRCLSLADTYGGKICAALDRQHPRDLYDIKYLLDNEGITVDVKDSFLFYLVSHNRPVNELLNPNLKDLSRAYSEEFLEMTRNQVSLNELIKYRKKLVEEIENKLTNKDREFIVSFVKNSPDWSLVRDSKIQDYPSVKWKLFNQEKMNKVKREKYIQDVELLFE